LPAILHLVRIRKLIEQVFAAVGDADQFGFWFTKANAASPEVGASLTLDFGSESVAFTVTKRHANVFIVRQCIQPDHRWHGTRHYPVVVSSKSNPAGESSKVDTQTECSYVNVCCRLRLFICQTKTSVDTKTANKTRNGLGTTVPGN